MGSLYIGGAQCVVAKFSKRGDVAKYDQLEEEIATLANKFSVAISRYSLDDDGNYSFVIMHKKANHQCFYAGAAFDYDMSVEVSDSFEERAKQFIVEIEKDIKFESFHKLDWLAPQVLYFTVS